MSKFIVIDPSIQGFGGHYYEYASRVLQAAEAEGYVPIMAANRCCQLPRLGSIEVRPVYRDAFWSRFAESQGPSLLKKALLALKRQVFIARVRLHFSSLGLLWAIRNRFGEYLQRRSSKATSLVPLLALLAIVYVFRILRAALPLCWHVIPFRNALVEYFRCLGRDCQEIIRVGIYPWARLLDPQKGLRHRIWVRTKTRRFCDDTAELFRQVPLAAGDIVFLTMASALELNVLAQYFKQDPHSSNATWHLLFRHQLFTGDDGGPYNEGLRPLRTACYQLQRTMVGQRVHFYTDTDDLTAQYNSLQIFPFQTLPIPIAEEYQAARRTAHHQRPLQIAYVGDARQEKGFHHLPRIVEDLWQGYVAPGRAVFAIQSNFNVPEGTPTTVIARAQLEVFPPDKVRLINQSLSPADYRKLVTSSDMILLPYDTRPYYAGSSGILVEALAAGIPVVVPAGIWMSKQFAEETRRHHESLATRLQNLGALSAEEVQWRLDPNTRIKLSADLCLGLAGGTRKPYTKLRVPEKAEFLLMSIGADVRDAQAPLNIWVDQHSRTRMSVSGKNYSLSPAESGRTVLIPIAQGAHVLYLQLCKTSPKSPDELYNIRFDFLAREVPGEPCPLGAVGLVYRDPDEITGLVREILDHYEHYQTTARAFSETWFRKHQASKLVAQICQAAEPMAEVRRAA